jgi:hypothetical protein
MTDMEREDGTTRDELVQRVALMEAMIAEGRQSTARWGWVFVMWGLIYFAAMAWVVFLPFKEWAWPVCIAVGIVVSVVKGRQRRSKGENQRSRSLAAVWQIFSAGITLYVIGAIASGHGTQSAYYAAIMFFIGLAHGTSARILRWGAQGMAAAVWCAGGLAMFFFTTQDEILAIFLIATFFGMILFGLYAVWLERRRAAGMVQAHA